MEILYKRTATMMFWVALGEWEYFYWGWKGVAMLSFGFAIFDFISLSVNAQRILSLIANGSDEIAKDKN